VDSTRLGIDHEVRDLEFVRAQLGLDRLTLIGWSYLGAVVALYAAEHPNRVDRLVQIGPMPPSDELVGYEGVRGSPADSTDRAFLAELVRAGRSASDPVGYCREYTMRLMIRPMMGRPDAAARARLDPCMYWNEWPEQLQIKIRHVVPADWDYTEQARRVTAPVLVVHGTEDPNSPVEGGRAWAALVQDGRLVEIEGVGHAPWLEAPDELFGAIESFLRDG
jgi:proline iminopeptidase